MSLAEKLEQTQWDFFWTPPDARIVDRPELAYISCDRPQLYLNTAVRVRASADALPHLIDEVSRAHLGPSRFQLAETIDVAPIERALQAAGYAPGDEHIASVIEVDAYAAAINPALRVERIATRKQLVDSITVMDAAFPTPLSTSDEEIDSMLEKLVVEEPRVLRFVAYDESDAPVASGGLSHFPSLGLDLLWGGATVPSARGQGAYSAILAARIAAARDLGQIAVGLYAKTDTSAPIVARRGFRAVGRMRQWLRAPR